jgi:hypothetical protein
VGLRACLEVEVSQLSFKNTDGAAPRDGQKYSSVLNDKRAIDTCCRSGDGTKQSVQKLYERVYAMEGETMANTDTNVDVNLVNIVNALNQIAGIQTYSSSGDYGDVGSHQPPTKNFTVSMDVRQDSVGWLAIATIQLAINVLDLSPAMDVRLSVCMDAFGEQTYSLHLELCAIGIEPDLLADSIRTVGEIAVIQSRGINRAYIIGEEFEPAWN